MRSLIIGASGQVGAALLRRCGDERWECRGTYFKHPQDGGNLAALDIRDDQAVAACVCDFKPDVIFLPGALTHVDYCETHPEECFAINVEGTANVARAAREAKARLVFFSTEHVFSDSTDAYAEDAPTAPMSVYAKSKAAAEERVRELLPDSHLILRTSWVFGPDRQRKNFVYRAVSTLREGKRLSVPSNQFGQPTASGALARVALTLAAKGATGTFHAVGPEHLTRLQFAQRIARVFALDAALIDGVPTASLGQPAPRPLHIRLAREKLSAALGGDPIPNPEKELIAMRDGAVEFVP